MLGVGAPTSGAVSPSELSACLLGVTVTNGAEERRGRHYGIGRDAGSLQIWRVSILTCKFMDCGAVEDIKGRVQLERLTAPLAHEADLHSCAR